MAFIEYIDPEQLPPDQRVADSDNIIQVHSVHPAVMKQHFDLYVQLMRRNGPLTFVQREMVATVVSGINRCKY